MSENDIYNKLIFKKYKILSLLGKGSFGYVFRGINIIDKQDVAIKIEEYKKKGDLLESEAYYLYYLKGIGIPEVKSFGIYGKYKVLVQTLLGDSLEDIFKKLNNNFTLKDICMIAIQLMDRFEYIHSKYIIHRDIKPDNITVDYETKKIIYLIDFGLAKKYRSSRTGKHIKFSIPKRLTGTARKASKNALRGKEQSRRDDLEAIGYVLIFFLKGGHLPWQGLKVSNKLERYKKIYLLKKTIEPESLCSDLPIEFCEYLKYVKSLKFEEEPNYKFLRELFINVLNKNNIKNDLIFSWLKYGQININNNNNDLNINENNKRIYNSKRRISPIMKIIKNIENNREKNKINNIDEKNKIIDIEKKQEEKLDNNLKININCEKKNLNSNDKCVTQITQLDDSIEFENESFEMERTKSKNIINKKNLNEEVNKDCQNDENLVVKNESKTEKNDIKNINNYKEVKKNLINNIKQDIYSFMQHKSYNNIMNLRNLSQYNINNAYNYNNKDIKYMKKEKIINTQINSLKNSINLFTKNDNISKKNHKENLQIKNNINNNNNKYTKIINNNKIYKKNNSEKKYNNEKNIQNKKEKKLFKKNEIYKNNNNSDHKNMQNKKDIKIIYNRYNINDLNIINNTNYNSFINNNNFNNLKNIKNGEIDNKINNIRNAFNYNSHYTYIKNNDLNNLLKNNSEYEILIRNNYFNNNNNIIIRGINNEKNRKAIRKISNKSKNVLNKQFFSPINKRINNIYNIPKSDINITMNQNQPKTCVTLRNENNNLYQNKQKILLTQKIEKKETYKIPIKLRDTFLYNSKLIYKRNNSPQIKSNNSMHNSLSFKTFGNIKNNQIENKNKNKYNINFNNDIFNYKIKSFNEKKQQLTKININHNNKSQKFINNINNRNINYKNIYNNK